MLDRILAILNYFQMSPSRFAEAIGVQRSGISHLISGRNKPSLEFIQKILARFPEVDPSWLLTGNGEMLAGGNPVKVIPGPQEQIKDKAEEKQEDPVKPEPVRPIVRKRPTDTAENPVEKVVYLYRDKTFREYYPGQDA
ncbi:MAG: helix-turn-helix domain-containing protein [Bacteroidetes bacterium]|nr:helix-turn-helix domain-containing protein [Bacteroidota bacterium]